LLLKKGKFSKPARKKKNKKQKKGRDLEGDEGRKECLGWKNNLCIEGEWDLYILRLLGGKDRERRRRPELECAQCSQGGAVRLSSPLNLRMARQEW
jgi:hypothetical protein